jgi:hypothetical protein
MKVVRLDEAPSEPPGQQRPDRGLAGAGDSHQDHDHDSAVPLSTAGYLAAK